jgi:hypothetical protein
MLGIFILFILIFLSAYFNPEFKTMIHINNYGEAHIELIVLIFLLLPLFLFTTALSFIDWKQTWKFKEKMYFQGFEEPPMKTPHRYARREKIECPRCSHRFEAVPSPEGIISCPRCGLVGKYEMPEHPDMPPVKRPEVNVIRYLK